MNYNYLSKLNDQNKIISSNIKKKNIHRLINLIKNYDLNEKNQDNIKNFLLKLAKKKNKNFINIKILIVSNLSFKIFEKILIEKLLLSRIGAEIFFSDYNETLKMEKKLGKFDYIFIYPNKTDFNEISKFSNNLNYNLRDLKTIKNFYEMLFKKVKHFSTSKVFLSNILPYVNSEFGNYTRLADNNKFEMIDNLNLFILEKAKNYKFYFFDNCFLSSKFGLNGLEDLEKFYLARIPFSQEYANYFFSVLSNAISVSLGRLKKVLVLDLDNTIWGGILGDDGYEKIVIDSESPIGLAYSNFQQFILNLKKRGVLLAISSKNLFENVKNAFQKNKN